MTKTLYSAAQAELVGELAEARKDAGLSQATLAQKLNCHQSLIARIESGQRRIDVIEFLILSRAIGFEPKDTIRRVTTAIPEDAGL